MSISVLAVDELAARVADNDLVAVPPDYSFVPMELVRALIRRGARNLDVLATPTGGIAIDLLIGAGAVRRLEAAAVSLGELGPAPRFTAAVCAGEIEMLDSTCPAIHAALQAAEKGVPFMPLRGLIGSDIAAHRPDWRVIANPMAGRDDPIVLLPALRPDVAIMHAPYADPAGNVWIGRRRELATMAHAALRTVVTVERIEDTDLLADETLAAGTLSAVYVEAIAVAPRGAWPLGMTGLYEADAAHLEAYAREAGDPGGFARYLEAHVRTASAAAQ